MADHPFNSSAFSMPAGVSARFMPAGISAFSMPIPKASNIHASPPLSASSMPGYLGVSQP